MEFAATLQQKEAFKQKYATQNRKNLHKNIAVDYNPS